MALFFNNDRFRKWDGPINEQIRKNVTNAYRDHLWTPDVEAEIVDLYYSQALQIISMTIPLDAQEVLKTFAGDFASDLGDVFGWGFNNPHRIASQMLKEKELNALTPILLKDTTGMVHAAKGRVSAWFKAYDVRADDATNSFFRGREEFNQKHTPLSLRRKHFPEFAEALAPKTRSKKDSDDTDT